MEKDLSSRQKIGIVLVIVGVSVFVLALALIAFYGKKPSELEKPAKANIYAWCPSSGSRGLVYYLAGQAERVVITKIGVNEVIREGVDDATLEKGVGHFPETARPGDATGNVALTAHGGSSSTHGAPFERLVDLEKGDSIVLYDRAGGVHLYVVTERKIIEETDFSVLESTKRPSVTLITCVVPSRITHQRRVVVGVLKK